MSCTTRIEIPAATIARRTGVPQGVMRDAVRDDAAHHTAERDADGLLPRRSALVALAEHEAALVRVRGRDA
jgi:hypothetical protein